MRLCLYQGLCKNTATPHFKQGEDLVELDHITPTSRGGDGMYINLQLLHGHCHDAKTATEQAVKGTPDKSHPTEEPCERKRTDARF